MHISHSYSAMQVWNKLLRVVQCKRPISHVFQTSGLFSITGVVLQCYEWLGVWNDVCVPGRLFHYLSPSPQRCGFGFFFLIINEKVLRSWKEIDAFYRDLNNTVLWIINLFQKGSTLQLNMQNILESLFCFCHTGVNYSMLYLLRILFWKLSHEDNDDISSFNLKVIIT